MEKMSAVYIIFICLTGLAAITLTEAVSCYNCLDLLSNGKGPCSSANFDVSAAANETCNGTCYVNELWVLGSETWSRGCEATCVEENTVSKSILGKNGNKKECCTGDWCNSAGSTLPSWANTVLIISAAYVCMEQLISKQRLNVV